MSKAIFINPLVYMANISFLAYKFYLWGKENKWFRNRFDWYEGFSKNDFKEYRKMACIETIFAFQYETWIGKDIFQWNFYIIKLGVVFFF